MKNTTVPPKTRSPSALTLNVMGMKITSVPKRTETVIVSPVITMTAQRVKIRPIAIGVEAVKMGDVKMWVLCYACHGNR